MGARANHAAAAYKVSVFERTGRTAMYEQETFLPPNLLAIFAGHEVSAQRYELLLETYPGVDMDANSNAMRAQIARAANALGTHADFVAKLCG